jgi:hypothetical protein
MAVPVMDFGAALSWLKAGRRVARSGWNGAGQFVVLQAGYPGGIAINQNTATATGLPLGSVQRFRPYLMLWTAQQDFVPWAPSVSDVLAEDWELVSDGKAVPSSAGGGPRDFSAEVGSHFAGRPKAGGQ